MRVASPRLKRDWEKHHSQTKRKVEPEELPDELADFVISYFIPKVHEHLEHFMSKRELRSFAAGDALSPENTLAFERAETHLDMRLKTLLNVLFGLQDHRERKIP